VVPLWRVVCLAGEAMIPKSDVTKLKSENTALKSDVTAAKGEPRALQDAELVFLALCNAVGKLPSRLLVTYCLALLSLKSIGKW
jgi:hypothetical protein